MRMLENRPYDELQVGDQATLQRTLGERELVLFADVSGDVNPVHLDADFAATTPFKGQIAHGMWSGALISAALATELPGPGTIYLEQSLKFRKPVHIGDTLSVHLEVLEKQPRGRVLIRTEVSNQAGETVVTGEARVLAPTEKQSLPAPELPKINFSQGQIGAE